MRRLAGGALFVAIAGLSGTAALACGDKLLAIGRGVRFPHASAAREANLVIYSGGVQGDATLNSTKMHAILRRSVRTLQVVQGGSQLDVALTSGRVDVVLVDFVNLAQIVRQLQSAASKPVILPVLAKPSKAEFAAAQKDYRFALKTTSGDYEYLTAIHAAMKSKQKFGAKS